MRTAHTNPNSKSRGLARREVLIVIATVAVLAGLGALFARQNVEEVRQSSCIGNLKQLGDALAMYSSDSADKLPYAFIQRQGGANAHSTWDGLIEMTVRVALRGKNLDFPAPPATRALTCPEDRIQAPPWPNGNRPKRRSYSMTQYLMRRNQWPPNAHRTTGLGLGWNEYNKNPKSPASLTFVEREPELPFIPRDMVQEPDSTILLTEQVQTNNLAGNAKGAVIESTIQHLDAKQIPWSSFHDGNINYLMVDGHVESLPPRETVGPGGQVGDDPRTHLGMWTLAPGD